MSSLTSFVITLYTAIVNLHIAYKVNASLELFPELVVMKRP